MPLAPTLPSPPLSDHFSGCFSGAYALRQDGGAGSATRALAESLNVGAGMLPTALAVRSDAKQGTVKFFRRTDPEGVREVDEVK